MTFFNRIVNDPGGHEKGKKTANLDAISHLNRQKMHQNEGLEKSYWAQFQIPHLSIQMVQTLIFWFCRKRRSIVKSNSGKFLCAVISERSLFYVGAFFQIIRSRTYNSSWCDWKFYANMNRSQAKYCYVFRIQMKNFLIKIKVKMTKTPENNIESTKLAHLAFAMAAEKLRGC